ncbi:hypothetical protein EIK77_001692 [Talaromyces pinophilus]|nr:hypothetical protein EIK77_001692 [Talaromyces pinophilus]
MLIRTSHDWELDMSLIPIILVEQSLETIVLTLSRARTKLSQVEKETGMHNYYIREEPSALNEPILNLENVTKRLTVLSAEFAHIDLVCNTQLRFLDKESEWEDKTWRALRLADSNYRRGLQPLSDRYAYARATLVSLLAHSEYSQKRTQSQVQTVRKTPYSYVLGPRLMKLGI